MKICFRSWRSRKWDQFLDKINEGMWRIEGELAQGDMGKEACRKCIWLVYCQRAVAYDWSISLGWMTGKRIVRQIEAHTTWMGQVVRVRQLCIYSMRAVESGQQWCCIYSVQWINFMQTMKVSNLAVKKHEFCESCANSNDPERPLFRAH